MTILPDFRIGIRLAFRAHLVPTVFWMTLALIMAVLMAAQFSGRQPATVALDVGISIIRLALPILIVLLSQELLSREFDRRYFLSSLTYPRPRHGWLLGRIGTILFLVLSLLLLMALLLGGLVWFVSQDYQQATPVALGYHYLVTLGFISIDLFVLTAMAAFLAIVASTPSFVLIGTLGFMLVARSFSSIIALLEKERYVVDNPELYQHSLGILGYLLPDLGALDVRMVSLYSSLELLPEDWVASIVSSGAYAMVLLALAIWVLQRKRFN